MTEIPNADIEFPPPPPTETPMLVLTRPFAIEPVTKIMLPDGVFDNALHKLLIACHYTNVGNTDLNDVTIEVVNTSDPGIIISTQTHTFERIAAGASVLVTFEADFEAAQPGKPIVKFAARAGGFLSRPRISRSLCHRPGTTARPTPTV